MNPLRTSLERELAATGALSFHRFMELALYHPEAGYYERQPDRIGRDGDFFTNVSVGSLWGELLAVAAAGWWRQHRWAQWQWLEAGAHDGRFAADFLSGLRRLEPEAFDRLEYCLLEPSARRRTWQQSTLADCIAKVRWLSSWDELSVTGVEGVIFSNELLDALPVRRLGWEVARQTWFEWGVAIRHGKLAWARMPLAAPQESGRATLPRSLGPIGGSAGASSSLVHGEGEQPASATRDSLAPIEEEGQSEGKPESPPHPGCDSFEIGSLFDLPAALKRVLPDGYTIELRPAAEAWWRHAAQILRRGKLITVDYGFGIGQRLSPETPHGTLRAYFRHHASLDLLARPGEQDLTAPADFATLRAIGESAGLATETLTSQARFLADLLRDASHSEALGPWTPKRLRQFQTLAHPEHLGQTFQVLIQSRH